jgi:putative membrane protein
MSASILAFLHHACAFLIVATLMVELVVAKGELTLISARSLLRMDAAYGMSALLLIVVGVLRVQYFEKGPGYYLHSTPFLLKMALFIAVGLLSIYPTKTFLSWRRDLRVQHVPVIDDATKRKVRICIHLELTLLFLMMLCAALMAHGIGYFG